MTKQICQLWIPQLIFKLILVLPVILLPDIVIKDEICKNFLSKEQLCNSYTISKKQSGCWLQDIHSRTFSKINASMKEELFSLALF